MINQAVGTSPMEKYQSLLTQSLLGQDQAQEQAVAALDELYQRLLRVNQKVGWFAGLRQRFSAIREPEVGLYFWGGVGRGKTMLMDLFFESLPFKNKMRLHFHRFMHDLHRRLKLHSGEKDPLLLIADEIAEQTCVICFDEFFVSDITDAMLLGGLFRALFKRGVSLVATSNIPPHQLYRNGLQRARFIPAIKLIEKYTQVMNVDGGVDYRLRTLQQARVFHCPHNKEATALLQQTFNELATEVMAGQPVIEIEHRALQTVACAEGVVWFDFHQICETARSHADYIEISRCYHTVVVSEVPILEENDNAAARRFISLVDEFYERNVKLLISAAAQPEQLYKGSMLSFEFERTLSRLQEMQSTEYLEREHLA